MTRDAVLLGPPGAVRAACRDRYHAAYRLYLAEVDARAGATYVVDNSDPEDPRLLSR